MVFANELSPVRQGGGPFCDWVGQGGPRKGGGTGRGHGVKGSVGRAGMEAPPVEIAFWRAQPAGHGTNELGDLANGTEQPVGP